MELPDLALYKEGLDVTSFPLVVDKVLSDQGAVEQCHIALVTLEGESVRIQLDSQGFHIIDSSTPYTPAALLKTAAADEIPSKSPPSSTSSPSISLCSVPTALARQEEARSGFVYETIEALLMALSPRFEAYFGDELSARLDAIDWSAPPRWHRTDSGSEEDNQE
ncbi:hypothetical protein DFQ26_008277 [Actinomortierella ambigua]|nr:hypothetical protein DFQ26_008277 [Actinomortierella ambigua]